MKYFIDTEFAEGTQKNTFPISLFNKETKPTIDLISIGIVAEDGREYYAISKDFNLKEAWNRYQIKKNFGKPQGLGDKKEYWIRENVLKPIWIELKEKEAFENNNSEHGPYFSNTLIQEIISKVWNISTDKQRFKELKRLLNKYGKTNKQIAKEIKHFVANRPIEADKEQWILDYDTKDVKFYGYYADYDWVVFCWLFGKMLNLPKGFPMMMTDIQQQIEEYKIDKNKLLNEVPQTNCHKSLNDAIWNKKAYNWIQNEIKDRNNR